MVFFVVLVIISWNRDQATAAGGGKDMSAEPDRDHIRCGGPPEGPPLLLLHGLGATGGVWERVCQLAEERWPGPWFAPDLSGHGRAPRSERYSFGAYAAEVAPLLAGSEPGVVVGHSMGGVVALALASGWFGPAVRACIGVGIKVSWREEELAGAAALAAKPARTFDSAEEATARYLRVSGLEGLVTPDAAIAAEGIAPHDGGWRLAHDPRSFAVGAPDMAGLIAAARGEVLLAAGEHDPMCTPAALAALPARTMVLDGLGHNAHVEDPEAVWRLIAATAGVGGAG